LAADDERALRRSTWPGKNLLGEILTEVRNELIAGCAVKNDMKNWDAAKVPDVPHDSRQTQDGQG